MNEHDYFYTSTIQALVLIGKFIHSNKNKLKNRENNTVCKIDRTFYETFSEDIHPLSRFFHSPTKSSIQMHAIILDEPKPAANTELVDHWRGRNKVIAFHQTVPWAWIKHFLQFWRETSSLKLWSVLYRHLPVPFVSVMVVMRVLDARYWPPVFVGFGRGLVRLDVMLQVLELLLTLVVHLVLWRVQTNVLVNKVAHVLAELIVLVPFHQRVQPWLGHERQLSHADLIQQGFAVWVVWVLLALVLFPFFVVFKHFLIALVVILGLQLFKSRDRGFYRGFVDQARGVFGVVC